MEKRSSSHHSVSAENRRTQKVLKLFWLEGVAKFVDLSFYLGSWKLNTAKSKG
jgi:hypothetical protein